MHSLAMAQDILEAALNEAKEHNAKHVKTISVKVGDGHFAESDSLQFCLEAAAQGTIAEEAQIEIELVGATAECRECARVFQVKDHLPVCPHCGGRNTEVLHEEEPLQITLELD
jgi:hydrogenase nickel incorporation protein HypA/HybF